MICFFGFENDCKTERCFRLLLSSIFVVAYAYFFKEPQLLNNLLKSSSVANEGAAYKENIVYSLN